MYYIIIGLTFLISMIVSQMLKSKFKKYSKIPIDLTGKEIAEKMLSDNGIHDVKVISTPGALTDHYNPVNKTVNLSEWVYNQRTVSAAAVAAHECGHAVQHARAYTWLMFRSKMVPAVSISSRLLQWVLLAGIALYASNYGPVILLVGIVLFGITTLFSFVTLPVEFDASNRALAWLNTTNIVSGQQHDKAADALKWAAMTYVVAALGSLAQLMYWVMVFLNRK
jgi:uncharacterized protein